jgi:hypothetical protein
MTPGDAATLVVALLGSNQTVDSVATVRRYGKANALGDFSAKELSEGVSSKDIYEGVAITALTDLPPDHSFIDALTALIATAAEEKLLPTLRHGWPENNLTVTVQNPATVARIQFALIGGSHITVSYATGWPPDVKTAGPSPRGDLEEFRRVSAKTIIYLGAALTGKLDELPAMAGGAAPVTAPVGASKSRARSARKRK